MDGALADYDHAIRLKPDNPINMHNRGLARKVNGDFEGALADFNEAIRLQPDFSSAIENRDLVLKAIADRSKS